MQDHSRIIHLSEISAIDFPVSNHYKYKCRVQLLSTEGKSLLEKDLFARMQPSWLVELKNRGDCTIAITFCYREGDISHPWQDAGEVRFTTQDYLNGESSTELEFPLITWNQAPQLKLKARLTQSTNESNNSTVSLFNNQNGHKTWKKSQTNGKVTVELPKVVTLTPSEEVIIKHV